MTRSSSGNLRSHALRTMTERQSQNQSSDRLSRTTIVSEAEAVEPIDYEEYVSQHSEQRDSLSRLLTFPEDDIDVTLVQRKIRTEHHVLPEEVIKLMKVPLTLM